MGGRYCAINSPLGSRWGQKSLDLRSRDFCPHLEPRGELIAQYRPPMSFRYNMYLCFVSSQLRCHAGHWDPSSLKTKTHVITWPLVLNRNGVVSLTHCSLGGVGLISNVLFSNASLWLLSWAFPEPLGEWCRNLLLISRILVQVMAWCHQATINDLNQCWLRSITPYDISRP